MRNKQQGMTLIGMIIMLTILGIIGFGVLQLVPVYLESMKIAQVLNQVKNDLEGQSATVADIRKSLGKRVDIEALYDVNYRTDFVITRTGNGLKVQMKYERKRPYFGNISLVADFDHSVEIIR
jgi:type II secretory pathway pseudopilin PulG